MWSGETVCSQPPSSARPWTVITLEPMPSIAAPIFTSMRARSCTWGSDAALRITVVPSISAAAMSAFSVPITDGSSMKKSQACRPPSGARRGCRARARPSRRGRGTRRGAGSRRRRPITSPPGGGITALPKRVSSGPATRNEARMRSARAPSTSVVVTSAACSEIVFSPRRSTRHAEVVEQLQHRLHVPDVRDVVEHDLLRRQQAAGQQRQGRVLVAGGHDRAGQRHPAFDDEFLHGRKARLG